MNIFEVGHTMPLRDLNELLKMKHDDERRGILERLARREENGVEDDDLDQPLKDPGEFKPSKELEGIQVSLRCMSMRELRACDAFFNIPDSVAADERHEFARREMFAAARRGIAEVRGLKHNGKELTLDDLEDPRLQVPQVWGLVFTLMTMAMHFQTLPGDKKKAYS